MSLTTLKSIEESINLITAKKEKLREAFENLQSQSPSTPLLNFTWSDLDSYITSFHAHLINSLSELKPQSQKLNPELECKSKKDPVLTNLVPARPELKALCEKNDGLGLRSYVIEQAKDRPAIMVELVDAFRHAPDPGSMVLDALDGFWEVGPSSAKLRNGSVLLLEEFTRAGLDVSSECKSRAFSMAVEWKGKILGGGGRSCGDSDADFGLERLGFLHLLGAYKLLDDDRVCSLDEVISNVVAVSKFRQVMDLCWKLGLENNVSDIVKRLLRKGKQLWALRYIFEFQLTDEFPPVPLLKEYVMTSTHTAQQVRINGKNSLQALNDAAAKEISALKAAIKCIHDHNLESEYPKTELLTRLEKLEKEKADTKRPAATSMPKNQNHPKPSKQNANKRMKPSPRSSVYRHTVPSQPLSQPSAIYMPNRLPNHARPLYGGLTSGPYGPMDLGPQVGMDSYGLSRSHLGYSVKPNRSPPIVYPPEIHAHQPVYYGNRVVGHGGYDHVASQYHPVYYPQ